MRIEVSLAPSLYACRNLKGHHATVAIDLLRATTALCAAFQAGCSSIVPLEGLDGLAAFRQRGYLLAAERGGEKVGDADFGNSPTEYLQHDMSGLRLAYSTTNGTVCLLKAADAALTLAGCFANISALCQRLQREDMDTVLLCSGWEGDFCLEDTLVAGAIIERLAGVATPHGDAAQMALTMWQVAKADPLRYCDRASHVHRLEHFGARADVEFAFQCDTCPVVPVLKDGILTL